MSGPPVLIATSNPHKLDEFRAIFAPFGIPIAGLHEVRPLDPACPTFAEPAETGRSFEENATIKALSYARQSGRVCLADDSGLEIDALGGRPGVISSHYSTDGRETGLSRAQRDAANNARVMGELEGVPIEKRSARFVCVIVLAVPPVRSGWSPSPATRAARPYDAPNDELNHLAERLARVDAEPEEPHVLLMSKGTFEGRIGLPPRVPSGKHGFGYDPLFLVAHPTAPAGDRPAPYAQTGAELDPETKNRLSHRARAANVMVDLILRAGLSGA